jgi:hypothetical protein
MECLGIRRPLCTLGVIILVYTSWPVITRTHQCTIHPRDARYYSDVDEQNLN